MSERELRCYRVRVETPWATMQNAEATNPGISALEFERLKREEWDEFARRHGVKVRVDIKRIDCADFFRVRTFFRKKKER